MNLEYLNLDMYSRLPNDEQIQIAVVLIATDLQCRKLMNGLTGIGCDACFCVPDLCDLVLAFTGFNERPNELYDHYFRLLIGEEANKITRENRFPIEEAFRIYRKLQQDRQLKRFL